jgi:hypothetical protein
VQNEQLRTKTVLRTIDELFEDRILSQDDDWKDEFQCEIETGHLRITSGNN